MLRTYPMNNTDYGAEDAELFHCTRTSGVFDGGDFACTATGADNAVTVGTGIAWIRNAKFRGKVAALKTAEKLDMGVANATYPRIDAVVLRYEEGVGTKLVAKTGTAASSPKPPEVVRTEAVYELHLCHVRREAGAASIPVNALSDLRADANYCGLMRDDVTGTGGKITESDLPVVPMSKGGTGATNGATGLKNLLAAGYTQLSSYQIVESLPSASGLPDGTVMGLILGEA